MIDAYRKHRDARGVGHAECGAHLLRSLPSRPPPREATGGCPVSWKTSQALAPGTIAARPLAPHEPRRAPPHDSCETSARRGVRCRARDRVRRNSSERGGHPRGWLGASPRCGGAGVQGAAAGARGQTPSSSAGTRSAQACSRADGARGAASQRAGRTDAASAPAIRALRHSSSARHPAP
jgi:hypothetical protein